VRGHALMTFFSRQMMQEEMPQIIDDYSHLPARR
jgi:hypothetical protein